MCILNSSQLNELKKEDKDSYEEFIEDLNDLEKDLAMIADHDRRKNDE